MALYGRPLMKLNAHTKEKLRESLRQRLDQHPNLHFCDLINEYEKFVYLKCKVNDFNDEQLAAPAHIHMVWEAHILNTAIYSGDCIDMYGEVINRNPTLSNEQLRMMRHGANVAHQLHFGFLPQSWKIDL